MKQNFQTAISEYKLVIFSPAISSLNLGDQIIQEAFNSEMESLINKSFVVLMSSHQKLPKFMNLLKNFDFKFVTGSNLLRGKMNQSFRQWEIGISDAKYLKNTVLCGVGWWKYNDDPNFYTRYLYNAILSKTYFHSVRDSYTQKKLFEMGIKNVYNTGCPTMWNFTEEHCLKIPTSKSESVIFTLTDYNKNFDKDIRLIKILKKSYKNIYFFPQGQNDIEYLNSLGEENGIFVIPSNLSSFNNQLIGKIDYIGTRLHGGIRALQYCKRTLIIGVDNRAIEIHKNTNLPVISRDNIEKIEDFINDDFKTSIKMPFNEINKWKKQFLK